MKIRLYQLEKCDVRWVSEWWLALKSQLNAGSPEPAAQRVKIHVKIHSSSSVSTALKINYRSRRTTKGKKAEQKRFINRQNLSFFTSQSELFPSPAQSNQKPHDGTLFSTTARNTMGTDETLYFWFGCGLMVLITLRSNLFNHSFTPVLPLWIRRQSRGDLILIRFQPQEAKLEASLTDYRGIALLITERNWSKKLKREHFERWRFSIDASTTTERRNKILFMVTTIQRM